MKEIKHGEIYLADLDPVKGHEQSGYRPVLVLQKDPLNRYLNTVVIAPLTKNLKARGHLTTFFLDKKSSKLKHDSVVLLFHLRTVDRLRLTKLVSRLGAAEMQKIREQLAFVI